MLAASILGKSNRSDSVLYCACHCLFAVLIKRRSVCVTMGVYPVELGALHAGKITTRLFALPIEIDPRGLQLFDGMFDTA